MASLPPNETSAEPPRTFKEFLLFHNLDDWPRFPYMPDMDDRPLLVQIRKDFPADALVKYLYDKAPLPIETISDLEKRVDDCKTKAHEHAKHVFSLEPKKSVLDDQMVSILNQADESQEVRNKKKVKIIAEPVQDSSCKTAENFKFPGFNLQKLTKLPNHLEPAQLWDSVLKTKVIRGVNMKMLKKLFISDASLAVLQDCFWWWFLHKFKPDQDEQDRFFDRISDSFVVLLLNAPNYMKDPFFQVSNHANLLGKNGSSGAWKRPYRMIPSMCRHRIRKIGLDQGQKRNLIWGEHLTYDAMDAVNVNIRNIHKDVPFL